MVYFVITDLYVNKKLLEYDIKQTKFFSSLKDNFNAEKILMLKKLL